MLPKFGAVMLVLLGLVIPLSMTVGNGILNVQAVNYINVQNASQYYEIHYSVGIPPC